MAPSAWTGAGSAPYDNVIGTDPQLTDPDNGDYRPAPRSPAIGYGCQIFGRRSDEQPPAGGDAGRPPIVLGGEVIEFSGVISADTRWNADLVRVVGNVLIKDGVTLTVDPGVRVEFAGFYRLEVAGTLLAVGTPDSRIVFTAQDPQSFAIDRSTSGGWNGIRFFDPLGANLPSRLAYCVAEYSKAVGTEAMPHPYGGGAVSVVDHAGLSIENCIFRRNVADFGGAIFLYRHANVRLAGSLITDNHALTNAAAIYCAYSHPELVNNTIVGNVIHNEEDPYVDSCALLSFVAKPHLANNIIRDNDPTQPYLHYEVWENKAFYTHHNNIGGGITSNGNLDIDPLFLDPDGLDDLPGTPDDNYRVLPGAPGIDAGNDDLLPAELAADLDGAARIFDGDGIDGPAVDQGAYEAGDCNQDGQSDLDEIAGGLAEDCNANLIPDACEIGIYGSALDCNANEVPDACETLGSGDFNADGTVDLTDFAALAECLSGPGSMPAPGDVMCISACLEAFDEEGDGDVDLADLAAFAVDYVCE